MGIFFGVNTVGRMVKHSGSKSIVMVVLAMAHVLVSILCTLTLVNNLRLQR